MASLLPTFSVSLHFQILSEIIASYMMAGNKKQLAVGMKRVLKMCFIFIEHIMAYMDFHSFTHSHTCNQPVEDLTMAVRITLQG